MDCKIDQEFDIELHPDRFLCFPSLCKERCENCNTHLWEYKTKIGTINHYCPFCELHACEKPMYDESMTPELKCATSQILARHINDLEMNLELFEHTMKEYPMISEVEARYLVDRISDGLPTLELSSLIDALAARLFENVHEDDDLDDD